MWYFSIYLYIVLAIPFSTLSYTFLESDFLIYYINVFAFCFGWYIEATNLSNGLYLLVSEISC